ncbi:MAG: hypothetical protein RL596_2453 [Bacteroidota bacterium]|jgi:hypothetical protein
MDSGMQNHKNHSNHSIIRALYLALIIGFIPLTSLSNTIRNNDSVKALYVTYDFPTSIVQIKGKSVIKNEKDTIKIFKFNQKILIKLYAKSDFETGNTIANSESVLLYKNNSNLGYFFPKITDTSKFRNVKVDSFINKLSIGAENFTLADTAFWLEQKRNIKEDEEMAVVRKFTYKREKNSTTPDTLLYFFDKKFLLQEDDISRLANSKKHGLLVKIIAKFNPQINSKTKEKIPGRQIVLKILRQPDIQKQDFKEMHYFDLLR